MKFWVGVVLICGAWVFFTSLFLGGGFQVLNLQISTLPPCALLCPFNGSS
jgi:hypothetical protein